MSRQWMNRQCGWHTKDDPTYLQAHADAEKRISNGEKQIECGMCGCWFWPDFFGAPADKETGVVGVTQP